MISPWLMSWSFPFWRLAFVANWISAHSQLSMTTTWEWRNDLLSRPHGPRTGRRSQEKNFLLESKLYYQFSCPFLEKKLSWCSFWSQFCPATLRATFLFVTLLVFEQLPFHSLGIKTANFYTLVSFHTHVINQSGLGPKESHIWCWSILTSY